MFTWERFSWKVFVYAQGLLLKELQALLSYLGLLMCSVQVSANLLKSLWGLAFLLFREVAPTS